MKKITPILFVIGMTLILISCKDKNPADYGAPVPIEQTSDAANSNHPGKKLMENQCYVCHNPSTDHKGRIAPPMVAVKSHYMTDSITNQEFVTAIWDFVEKPNPYKSKMKGAVNRFGLMPYQAFKEEEIKLIADYIYKHKIDEPDWFKDHLEAESNGEMPYSNNGIMDSHTADTNALQTIKTPANRGLEYALNTKKELGKNLMQTIQKKGTKAAVTFCNKEAYPITERMAIAQNATIKRVSDKPRNPKNQANSKEMTFISQFKTAIAGNKTYQPITEIKNGRTHFYAPITTNSMCLQCHGTTNKDIQPDVLNTILQLYPQDKATGYGVNEVRGLWSITYDTNAAL